MIHFDFIKLTVEPDATISVAETAAKDLATSKKRATSLQRQTNHARSIFSEIYSGTAADETIANGRQFGSAGVSNNVPDRHIPNAGAICHPSATSASDDFIWSTLSAIVLPLENTNSVLTVILKTT